MTADIIGSYAQAHEDEDPNPWHRIESVIDHDAITKCGRRLHVYAVESVVPGDAPRCRVCHPEAVAPSDIPVVVDEVLSPADAGGPA